MKRIKVYISHSIRGIAGSEATQETMNANNQKALIFVKHLRENFPNIDFYCPAEHEDWIQKAFNKKIITIDNILSVDCDIVFECHILLVYTHDQYLSSGMLQEIWKANLCGIPIIITTNTVDVEILLNHELKRMMVG